MVELYLLIGVLFIGIIILFLFKLEWGNAITFLMSGFERLSINIGFTLTPLVLIAFVLIPITLLRRRRSVFKINRTLMLICVGIALSTGLSLLFSHYRLISAKSSIFILVYLVLLLVEYILIRFYKNTEIIFISMIVSASALSLYAIVQFIRYKYSFYPDVFNTSILNNGALNPLDFASNGTIRPNSFFDDVNTSAGFLILYLPFCAVYAWKEVVEFKKRVIGRQLLAIFIIFSFISSLVAFLMMQSRASFIGVGIIGIVVYFYMLVKYQKIRTYMAVVLIGLILISGGYGLSHKSSIGNKLKVAFSSEYSAQAHIAYLESAMREFKKQPLFGGGTGSFIPYFQNEQKTGLYGYYPSVDNPPLFIKYLAENGVVGLILNSMLIIFVIFIGIKESLVTKEFRSVIIFSLLLGFIGLVVANFFHAFFPLYFSAVFIGAYIGLLDENRFERENVS